jgi:hypothetical protein
MYIPEEARRRAGDKANFSVTADQFGRVWKMLGPGALQGAEVTAETDRVLTVRKSLSDSGDQGTLECDIERETLTVREYRFIDSDGKLRQTLKMALYRLYGEADKPIVWPSRIIAEGEDSRRIAVRLSDPEFNGEVPAAAFAPPARAVKQP